MWAGMESVAHTLAYDGRIVDGFRLARERVSAVQAATLVLDGGQTPWLSAGADALAEALPYARRRTLDGQPHNVAVDAITPVLADFFAP